MLVSWENAFSSGQAETPFYFCFRYSCALDRAEQERLGINVKVVEVCALSIRSKEPLCAHYQGNLNTSALLMEA